MKKVTLPSTEDPNFTEITESFSIAEIEELCSNGKHRAISMDLFSILNDHGYEPLLTEFYSVPSRVGFRKPNAVMAGYESNPGVWLYKHETSGCQFLMFSDVHRKNAFKGTSFEFVGNKDMSKSEEKELFKAFLNFLQLGVGPSGFYKN